jgi:ubiquinone/menaquinone biosynthesis C-methylase UbiE
LRRFKCTQRSAEMEENMKQNKYDDKTFFDKYSKMDRSVKGLAGAGEWKTLEAMLPCFTDQRVLDLGCGFGWHCQYAIEHGAKSVTGIDLSENMINVAREKTDKRIEYIHSS